MREARPTRASSSASAPPSSHAGPGATQEDLELLAALRTGDEAAFMTLVNRYHTSLLRLALLYVRDRAVAEEVVQDTWLGVLNHIDTFEPRASLKAWIFRILVNRARTSAQREGRSIPFSATWDAQEEGDESAMPADRFQPNDASSSRPGWWASPPRDWGASPEEALLASETRAYLASAIATLPASQREVITLRDIEGLPSMDVCNILGVTEMNQRVLLHRARAKVRLALERYFTQEP